jgi:hypothetical protein
MTSATEGMSPTATCRRPRTATQSLRLHPHGRQALAGARAAIMYCDFTITHNWRSLNGNLPMQDARHTDIVGYQTPAEFYVPTGNDESTIQYVYANRRTFYWNPSLTTDANGEAVVECYNGKNNTFLDVNAETLCNGKPATVEFRSAQ